MDYITSYSFHTLEIVNKSCELHCRIQYSYGTLSLRPYRELVVWRMDGWVDGYSFPHSVFCCILYTAHFVKSSEPSRYCMHMENVSTVHSI